MKQVSPAIDWCVGLPEVLGESRQFVKVYIFQRLFSSCKQQLKKIENHMCISYLDSAISPQYMSEENDKMSLAR